LDLRGDECSEESVLCEKFSSAGLVISAFITAAALAPGRARAVPLAAAPGSLATVDTGNAV
jgi:hypothetical protein